MKSAEALDPSELVQVFTNLDEILINIARDHLTGCGIASYIFDSNTPRMLGVYMRGLAAIPLRLMVHAQDAERARQCLKALGFPD